MLRSRGRCNFAVGAVVVMLKLTSPVAVMPWAGPVQVERATVSLQVKVTGPVNPEVKVTVTVAFTFDPCATWKLAAVGAIVNADAMVTVEADDVEVFSVALPM